MKSNSNLGSYRPSDSVNPYVKVDNESLKQFFDKEKSGGQSP